MSDLISRQAAIDAMFANMPGLMFNDVLRILRTLPPAQPERKTGRWELGPFDRLGGYWTTCSVCERPSFGGGKYCRYCGADMRTPTQVQMDEADDVMMGGNDETD